METELNQYKRLADIRGKALEDIRKALIDARFAPIIQEQGSCVKTSIVDHIKTLIEYNKNVEKVRDKLREELYRLGYTEQKLRELIKLDNRI